MPVTVEPSYATGPHVSMLVKGEPISAPRSPRWPARGGAPTLRGAAEALDRLAEQVRIVSS